jgi:hypothetical protein
LKRIKESKKKLIVKKSSHGHGQGLFLVLFQLEIGFKHRAGFVFDFFLVFFGQMGVFSTR